MKSAVALALLLCEFIVSFEANVVEEYIMSTVKMFRELEGGNIRKLLLKKADMKRNDK